jgi:hypothetical protein
MLNVGLTSLFSLSRRTLVIVLAVLEFSWGVIPELTSLIPSIKLRYYIQNARFVAATLKRPFVASGEQLTPLITLWCKEKEFIQSATGLALHTVCAKREGTYEIIFKVDVPYYDL